MGDAFAADDVARLRIALARVSRLIDRQAAGELTRTELSVLGTIARMGPLGMGELAEIEGVNPTMLSRLIAKLEDVALVRRHPHPDDRRAVMVAVTASGARLHSVLRMQRTEYLSRRLALLPEGRADQLLAALPALEALAEQMARAPSAQRASAVSGSAP